MNEPRGWATRAVVMEPASGAVAVYAQGITACERLGLPLSCLRVYYKVRNVGFPVLTWRWDGSGWLLVTRGRSTDLSINTRLLEYRRGAWAEFDNLDDAKAAGLLRRETKIYPSEPWGTRHNYRLPEVHPANDSKPLKKARAK